MNDTHRLLIEQCEKKAQEAFFLGDVEEWMRQGTNRAFVMQAIDVHNRMAAILDNIAKEGFARTGRAA